MKYYILPVWGGVDPETLIGPFRSYESMRSRARKIHAKQSEEDSIFWLSTIDGGKPHVGSFTNVELGA